ncbi:class I SAM-dependent methyltransferase [filamentous cyanobacterium LEGE 11480]|uniref:Class I SAM-dependent methyltransferase n=1 Tax=Romeriopsis navalis LEGE 11480 TaxID=2777977 RepID=A0A928VM05_9CYAN|nr:class I SAM-dependent methyltransferase [Romeriopsis navalis]MBE9028975.1 class I SAM-dependent methyltransferase [Romeriopsis navalis LEGE 11480]
MAIAKILARALTDYGVRMRTKRVVPLLEMIDATFEAHGSVNIIDIGGREEYWEIVPPGYLEQKQVSITIVNLPGTNLPEDYAPFKFVTADGCDLSAFEDKSFHIAHSNSVVEHVGDWDRMSRFSQELARVAQSYFVQTPNFWFPLEPHCMTPFFHWLPKPLRVWLVSRLPLGHWRQANSIDEAVRMVESARLLNQMMFQELFQETKVLTERWLVLPKSFIAIKYCD